MLNNTKNIEYPLIIYSNPSSIFKISDYSFIFVIYDSYLPSLDLNYLMNFISVYNSPSTFYNIFSYSYTSIMKYHNILFKNIDIKNLTNDSINYNNFDTKFLSNSKISSFFNTIDYILNFFLSQSYIKSYYNSKNLHSLFIFYGDTTSFKTNPKYSIILQKILSLNHHYIFL